MCPNCQLFYLFWACCQSESKYRAMVGEFKPLLEIGCHWAHSSQVRMDKKIIDITNQNQPKQTKRHNVIVWLQAMAGLPLAISAMPQLPTCLRIPAVCAQANRSLGSTSCSEHLRHLTKGKGPGPQPSADPLNFQSKQHLHRPKLV